MEKNVVDVSQVGPSGSGEARGFLAQKIDSKDLMFLVGVWGLFLGVMGYVLIFKP